MCITVLRREKQICGFADDDAETDTHGARKNNLLPTKPVKPAKPELRRNGDVNDRVIRENHMIVTR